jgi:hypothetical protein
LANVITDSVSIVKRAVDDVDNVAI